MWCVENPEGVFVWGPIAAPASLIYTYSSLVREGNQNLGFHLSNTKQEGGALTTREALKDT